MNARLAVGAALGLGLMGLLVTACGSSGLSSDEVSACELADRGGVASARDIFGLQSVLDAGPLGDQANRIKYGTTNESDADAMARMVGICVEHGWSGPGAD